MSTGREKDQKDYDFEQLVKVIDSALTSDNPAVQNALRSLLLISTIVSAEHPDQTLRHGPLSRMYEDMHNLARRISHMEDEIADLKRLHQPRTYTSTTPYIGGIPPAQTWDTHWPAAGDDPNYRGATSSKLSLDEISEILKENK